MALSGPNLYSEMATHNSAFTEATIGYDSSVENNDNDIQAARLIQQCLQTSLFQTSLCQDRVGVELCGGLKNVIALGVGFANGCFELGQQQQTNETIMTNNNNTRAAIMRAGMHEITRFMVQIMKFPPTTSRQTVFESSAGVGDLILTCTAGRGRLLSNHFVKHISEHGLSDNISTNIERWELLEQETLNGMKLPDWHNTQEVYHALVDNECVQDFPLLEAIYRIGFVGDSPESIYSALSRSIRVTDGQI